MFKKCPNAVTYNVKLFRDIKKENVNNKYEDAKVSFIKMPQYKQLRTRTTLFFPPD